MPKKMFKPALLLLSLLITAGCTPKATPASPSLAEAAAAEESLSAGGDSFEPLKVVVSTDYIREIMYVFANQRTKGRVLVGKGQNPLQYTPSKQDKKDILEADLVIINGLGLEPGLEAYLARVQDKIHVVALSDALEDEELIPNSAYSSGYDPHFWWNPELWEKAVLHVVKALSEMDPDNAFNYQSTYIRYGSSLSNLRRYFSAWMERLPEGNRYLLSINPAFTYFARAYDLHALSIYQPGGRDYANGGLDGLVDLCLTHNIKTVFPEAQIESGICTRLVEAAAKRGHTMQVGEELYSYFLGDPGDPEYVYIPAGKELINRIYTWLKAEGEPAMPARVTPRPPATEE